MKVELVAPTDRLHFGAAFEITIEAADVAALGASTTGTLQIVPETGTFPVGTKVGNCTLDLITAFDASDAAINSLLIEVGDGGDTDRYLTSTEVAADGTEIVAKSGSAATQPYSYAAADTVDVLFTVAGGASPLLSEINAGKLRLTINLINPTEARQPA